MSSILADIVAGAATEGLSLRRANPKGPNRLILEFVDDAGTVSAGQWHRDPERSAAIAEETRTSGGQRVHILAGTGIMLQQGGADRRLQVLQALARRPGARLVAHRAERRGVVRNPGGDYTKVVGPGRAVALADSLVHLSTQILMTPRVTSRDDHAGTLTIAELPGRTLHERIADPALSDDQLARDSRAVGVALRELHATAHPAARTSHDADGELAAARRWLEPAAAYGLLDPDRWQSHLDRAAELLTGRPSAAATVHRDLHDKQILIEPGAPVGLLDLDLATAGEPAVDLANLLVHLELRQLQGLCSYARATRCAAALVEGYEPGPEDLRRMPGYALTTRLRLAGLYAFRAAPPELVDRLIRDAGHEMELL